MADIGVNIEGLPQFKRALSRLTQGEIDKAAKKGLEDVVVRVMADAKPRVVALPSPGGRKAVSGFSLDKKQGVGAGLRMSASNPTLIANVMGANRHVGRSGPRFINQFPYTRGDSRTSRGGQRTIPWQPWGIRPWEETYGLGPAIKTVMDQDAVRLVWLRLRRALRPAFPKG